MPIQQKLPPPVLIFNDFTGWEIFTNLRDSEADLQCCKHMRRRANVIIREILQDDYF